MPITHVYLGALCIRLCIPLSYGDTPGWLDTQMRRDEADALRDLEYGE